MSEPINEVPPCPIPPLAVTFVTTHGFPDAAERGDNNLYSSGGDIVDKAGDEEYAGSSGLAFSAATSTALCGSVMAMASSSAEATPKYFDNSSGGEQGS